MGIENKSDEAREWPAASDLARLVEISDTQTHIDLRADTLKRLVEGTLSDEGIGQFSLSIALVDDATIRVLNSRHLGHDWATDVISFPLSEPGEPVLSGELIVSTETAARIARSAGIDPWNEVALYVVHGLLHLCGYDDKDPSAAEAMRLREGEILALRGLINPFPLAEPNRIGALPESAR